MRATMGGRRPVLSDAQAEEVLAVRRALAGLPTPRQLAERLGIAEKHVRRYLFGRLDQLPKRHECLMHVDRP